MHNPPSVLENETHKLLWDFDMQVDHRISDRRTDLIINNNNNNNNSNDNNNIKKENLQNCVLCCPG